mmetsp:Transcript_37768/g.62629  ORF Transcript_37768/g.62629 Transcript_37768/m.62629 type:complete len:907 (-) Transcript_37768:71-2791(-)|eukprot:CAMPEP_0184365768 /NCGR_PEP_ID=MMETSP1089-20130417/150532_1 /TAXON_ID=38269 ORGANISM="Gloeochaete wittrockiana, Strain SAG46.84" /NCGR_SAMPLE_ID=MMETSP1089 /ASSEMBLY_ACC=CAM_ASM_000445 /LENGTH=906 /DNA_ID=CAMNT_0026707127 /DNA_START=77 /DNA_END=2797 /DNA_ORIENTATION=+
MLSQIRTIVLALAVTALIADARVHSLNREFPVHDSTSGVWKFGYFESGDASYTLHLYEQANADPACGTGFTKFDRVGGGEIYPNSISYPYVMGCRISGQCFCGVSNNGGAIYLHPSSGLHTVVRFTAPTTGYYTFNATIQGWINHAQVSFVVNDVAPPFFSQQLQPIDHDIFDVLETVPLVANDFVDLIVDALGDQTSCGTDTVLTIVEVPAVLPSRTPSTTPTPTPDYCRPTRQINATTSGIRIRSNGGATYGPLLSCEWVLRAPANHYLRITFESFWTEFVNDYVLVYDSLIGSADPIANINGGELEGSDLPVFNLGSVGRVTFSSDENNEYGGFVALVTAVRGSRPSPTQSLTPSPSPTTAMLCDGQSEISASTSGSFFASNTIEQYVDSMYCSWLITAPANHFIRIEFRSFVTEPGYDYVRIYDGILTEGVEPVLALSGEPELPYPSASVHSPSIVTFTTDGSSVRSGFTAYAYAVRGALPTASRTPSSTPSPTRAILCKGDQTVDLIAGRPVVISSSTSGPYGDNMYCRWRFNAPALYDIKINFTSFDTEAGPDMVRVIDGPVESERKTVTLSGHPLPLPVLRVSDIAIVFFTSDGSATGAGFRAVVTAVLSRSRPTPLPGPFCEGTVALQLPSTCHGLAIFSNQPGYIGTSINCAWLFVAPEGYSIKVNFTSFDTYDSHYVRVYEGSNEYGRSVGRLSGQPRRMPVVYVRRSLAYMTYAATDEDLSHAGFVAIVSAFRPATSTPRPRTRTPTRKLTARRSATRLRPTATYRTAKRTLTKARPSATRFLLTAKRTQTKTMWRTATRRSATRRSATRGLANNLEQNDSSRIYSTTTLDSTDFTTKGTSNTPTNTGIIAIAVGVPVVVAALAVGFFVWRHNSRQRASVQPIVVQVKPHLVPVI